MIADGKLLIHLGGPGQGALFALDPETGKPLWAWSGDGPGYAHNFVIRRPPVRVGRSFRPLCR